MREITGAAPPSEAFAFSADTFAISDLGKISPELHAEIALGLIHAGKGEQVAKKIDKFSKLDSEVFLALLDCNHTDIQKLAAKLDKFNCLNQQVAELLVDHGCTRSVIQFLGNFTDIEQNQLADRMLNTPEAATFARRLDKFTGLSKTIALELIEKKFSKEVANFLGSFEGLQEKTALLLVKENRGERVCYFLEKFKDITHEKMALELVENEQLWVLAKYIDKFPLSTEQANVLVTRLVGIARNGELRKKDEFMYVVEINEFYGRPDKLLGRAYQDFFNALSLEIFDYYFSLNQGNIPEEIASLGVEHAGDIGINELRNKLREIRKELIDGTINIAKAIQSPILQKWIMQLVRFDASQWGSHDQKNFQKIVMAYVQSEGSRKPLPPEYTASPVVAVQKLESGEQKEFSHSPDVVQRYTFFLSNIKEAKKLTGDPDALEKISNAIKKKKQIALREIEEKMTSQKANPKAVESLHRKKYELESLDLTSSTQPQDLFQLFKSFKNLFDQEIVQLAFYLGFTAHPASNQKNFDAFSEDSPSTDELSSVIDFVDHTVRQETLGKYLVDPAVIKNLKGLLNVAALEQGRVRSQTLKGGEMPLQFLPNRNILTEFSGHIADACWASQYDSILSAFPNFVSVVFVQNPGHPRFERLGGATFLIETKGLDGTPLLVIRGLNPQENLINQLDVQSFFDTLIKYTKDLAQKRGRKLAIVIDEKSGLASTNRPALFEFLEKLKPSLSTVKLKSKSDTTFNDYTVVDFCYLLQG